MASWREATARRLDPRPLGGSPPMELELLYCDPDLALGGSDNVFVVLWRDRTTVAGVADVERVFRRFAQGRRAGIVMFTIVESGAKPPDAGAREPLARAMRGVSGLVAISAIVYEQTGFLAAAFRGIVTGLCLVAHQTFPHRMFKDVADAAQWIEGERLHLGKPFGASELSSSIAAFRALVRRSR